MRRGPQIALLGSSLVVSVAGLELAVRLLAGPRSQDDLDIFAMARPNAQGTVAGVPFRTNSQGIRGPEYPSVPPPQTFRIVIGGDSVTMGWGVLESDAYPQVLEGMLNEAPQDHPAARGPPGRRYEVINLGLAGTNAAHANRRIAQFMRVYRADLSVYGFTLNDLEGRHYRGSESAAEERAAWHRALRFHDSPSYLLRALWPRWILLIDPRFPGTEALDARVLETLRQNYFHNPEAWGAFEDALRLHASRASERGICGHVLIHTYLADAGSGDAFLPFYERVAEAAVGRGLTVSRSQPYFRGRDPEELRVSSLDPHPNAAAHRLYAQALFDGFRRLPERCWTPRRRARS